MNIEQKVTLTEAEVKSAFIEYLRANHLKPDNNIRLVFKNGESVEQVLFTDLEILWTASSTFLPDHKIALAGSELR